MSALANGAVLTPAVLPPMRFTGSFLFLAMLVSASHWFEVCRSRGRAIPRTILGTALAGWVGVLGLCLTGGVA